jgi:hypothetical protein
MNSLNRTLDLRSRLHSLRVLTWPVELEPSVGFRRSNVSSSRCSVGSPAYYSLPRAVEPRRRSPDLASSQRAGMACATTDIRCLRPNRPAGATAESNPPPDRFDSDPAAYILLQPQLLCVRRDHAIRVPRLLATEWMHRMCVSTCQLPSLRRAGTQRRRPMCSSCRRTWSKRGRPGRDRQGAGTVERRASPAWNGSDVSSDGYPSCRHPAAWSGRSIV